MHPIITLTTDFGTHSPYVAALKGVILGINPNARLLDLTHEIAPQNLSHAAFFLAETIPFFPTDVLHVIVVDPGVGTERPLLNVNLERHRLLIPDNGAWTELGRKIGGRIEVIRLEERRFWLKTISATFHGRDILAPAAAYLSLGVDAHELGPVTDSWSDFRLPEPQLTANCVAGEVLFVDHFGNMVTNIPGKTIGELAGAFDVAVGKHVIAHHVRTYGEADPGSLVSLVSSFGLLEIAERNGSASKRLNARVGTPVLLRGVAASGARIALSSATSEPG
jgi:S-adenosylmethionine hydrolase